ncbi:TadE/TadG family type IV pilus assembly protein [Labrys wisconsinensis]|uniref:Pilus assembly protein Flp/PilA n=1 Tax=Labrys wisconsinensis TaxID=425677 RepID=A0ABU0JDR3_9HYPH|nr:TadE/TadG family type IV pilus assembly protein [Labrys wisconsinensis]MDQ0472418.1 pilus assembly protein Flp/PilA [Labrys wisconsinensis]
MTSERLRGAALPKRFRRDQSGATAVEFGFVAMPFFALIFAIVEISLTFFTNQVLETAVQDAARQIMTGQSRSNNSSTAANNTQMANFKSLICAKINSAFIDCTKLQVDVETYTTFAAANTGEPIAGGKIAWTPGYQTGNPGDIVVVRAIYPMPTYTNFYGVGLANLSDGTRLLMATAVFRTEPFK